MNKKSFTPDSNFKTVSTRIRKEMKRLRVPGVSIGVYHQGKEWSAGFGVTSIEHPLAVTPDTLMQTGSISKTFTGTLLMMLAEQGKVDLDAPVRRYIKDFTLADKTVAGKVTIRHLLTHTGGWVGDYFNDFGAGDDALERMVKEIAKLPQVQPLGRVWSYNNTGFNIASRVIEAVTKKPYEKALQENLLDPLGLDMTYLYPNDILFTHRFVVGHYTEKKKVKVARPWAVGRATNGVGGVVSTVRDLLAYARFHMGAGKVNGKRVIQKKTLQAMRKKQVNAGGRGDMGITWFIRDFEGMKVCSHGGATHGQQAFFLFIPEKDFALALLTNSDDGGSIDPITPALDVYFGIKVTPPKPITVPAKELEELIGRYKLGTGCFDLKVKGKYLMYHDIPLGGFPTPETPPGPALPPMRFQFYEKDKLIGLDEPYKGAFADIIRDEKGRIEYFRVGGRAYPKEKSEAV
jgi:CubicO group peptidase (beta-lactamase class C family)